MRNHAIALSLSLILSFTALAGLQSACAGLPAKAGAQPAQGGRLSISGQSGESVRENVRGYSRGTAGEFTFMLASPGGTERILRVGPLPPEEFPAQRTAAIETIVRFSPVGPTLVLNFYDAEGRKIAVAGALRDGRIELDGPWAVAAGSVRGGVIDGDRAPCTIILRQGGSKVMEASAEMPILLQDSGNAWSFQLLGASRRAPGEAATAIPGSGSPEYDGPGPGPGPGPSGAIADEDPELTVDFIAIKVES